jgi:hypothetical protein
VEEGLEGDDVEDMEEAEAARNRDEAKEEATA